MKKSMLACTLLLAYSAANAGQLEIATGASASPQTTSVDGTATTTTTPTTTAAPTQTTTAAPQPTPQTISCHFHFPANTTIADNVVKMWAEKAVLQTFDYSSDNVDIRLQELKLCFTDSGWVGFTTALDQSGNLTSIRNQKLTVSAQIDGSSNLSPIKENQWKVTLPMEVVYQNKQDKVTQLLTLEVMIARKVSGDLGIQQIIASPRQEEVVKH